MNKYKSIVLFKYIFEIQLVALIFLAAVRILFVAVNFPDGVPFKLFEMLHAFILGARFDNHGASYIALLPLITAAVVCFFKRIDTNKVLNTFRIWYSVLYTVVLFLAVANVRYYSVFGWHINYEALGYLKFFDTTAGMLFEDYQNYSYIAIAVGVCVAFWITAKKITQRNHIAEDSLSYGKKTVWVNIAAIVLATGLSFIGMRGSFQRYVLRVSFASFSDIPFYNKIGNNAVFNIYETRKQSKKNVEVRLPLEMDCNESVVYVKKALSIDGNDTIKPLSRHVPQSDNSIKPNVVMVLMESMTLRNLYFEFDGVALTPFLRNLRDSAYYFENFYSAGIHTNNGICACMYGYTPDFSKPCMNQPSDLYTGLPYELKRHGYKTMTFITGDPHYDNMNSFLRENNIDIIYSQPDYPKEKLVNRFGVRDDYMFQYGINRLDENTGEPFFAMFLTCSNHSPYSIPDGYASRFEVIDDQAIAYADDAVRYFFENAVNTEWGKNTVFIFVADHGKPRGENIYDMVYYYNRIPCYIYSKLFEGKMHPLDDLGGQIDLFPTVMGLLGLDYTNNTLGIDLLKDHRQYIHFVSDEHLGCADKEFFYCYNVVMQKEFLYKIGSGENIISTYPEKAAEMKRYAVAMMKTNNEAVRKHWTNP